MAVVEAVCKSEKVGTAKNIVNEGFFKKGHGFVGDAHAGSKRQVSLLALESINKMRKKISNLKYGDFGENITTKGICLYKLEIGTKLKIGNVKLRITQIGKKCHDKCEIYRRVGKCIMPDEGVFAAVLESGIIKQGSEIKVIE